MYISNNQYQKNTNISSIFEIVWRHKDISRSAISKSLELYRSTITNIISSLIEKDLILEGTVGTSSSRGGRRPIFLTVNKNFGCVIGIDLQPETYSVSVLSIDGSVLFTTTGETPASEKNKTSPEKCFIHAIDKIIAAIIKPVAKLNIPVLGICVCVPGIVDCDKGLIKNSHVFCLHEFPFEETFYNRYGVPCIAENDARCLAWRQFGTTRGKQVHKDDFLCVLTKIVEGKKDFAGIKQSGIGIGLSLAVKGSIIHGGHYSAGEYISTSWDGTAPGQTGLSENIMDNVLKDEKAYRTWVIDLFKTLTMFVPLLGSEKVVLYGQPEEKTEVIKKIIREDVPQFNRALERYNSSLIIQSYQPHDLSEGAAFKFLQQMFVIMQTDNDSWIKSYDWDAAFELRQKGLSELQLHTAQ